MFTLVGYLIKRRESYRALSWKPICDYWLQNVLFYTPPNRTDLWCPQHGQGWLYYFVILQTNSTDLVFAGNTFFLTIKFLACSHISNSAFFAVPPRFDQKCPKQSLTYWECVFTACACLRLCSLDVSGLLFSVITIITSQVFNTHVQLCVIINRKPMLH